MTPVDRSPERGRPQAAGSIPSPAVDPSPSKPKPWDCAECRRIDTQEEAAFIAYDRSRLTDLRVLRRRHATQGHHA